MTIHELMQKWEFNYIIPFEYNSVDELVQNSDGTLMSLLAAKCHIPHKQIMYANYLWANEGKTWLNRSHYKHIYESIEIGICKGLSDKEINQMDYLTSTFAVAEVFNEMNRFHALKGNDEDFKNDRQSFLNIGGEIFRDVLGKELVTLLNNAINQ